MGVFDGASELLNNLLDIKGNVWVKRKNESAETIATCNGVAKDDETTHTCALCVALNHTVFKNDNKPEFYHKNCKCKQERYVITEITKDFPVEKITKYLFLRSDKRAMMRTMGYNIYNAEYVYGLLCDVIEKEFMKGNYKLGVLDIHGQHFAIDFVLDGINDHAEEKFNCHVGCVAWPYAKIKVATPLVKD